MYYICSIVAVIAENSNILSVSTPLRRLRHSMLCVVVLCTPIEENTDDMIYWHTHHKT